MYTVRSLFWLLCCLHIVDLFHIEIDAEGERQRRWATAGEWAEMGLDVGWTMCWFTLKLLKTHLSVFHCYFNLICAALECGQDWQRQCGISRDLCTCAICWECTNFFCPSDSPYYFLIMGWFPESFSLFFTCIIKQEASKKCHYKSPRKNNIDWRPRGLWITYWGRFVPAASSWHTQTPACCPVCARKIMAFLSIWKTYFVSLECWVILHRKGKYSCFKRFSIAVSTITF